MYSYLQTYIPAAVVDFRWNTNSGPGPRAELAFALVIKTDFLTESIFFFPTEKYFWTWKERQPWQRGVCLGWWIFRCCVSVFWHTLPSNRCCFVHSSCSEPHNNTTTCSAAVPMHGRKSATKREKTHTGHWRKSKHCRAAGPTWCRWFRLVMVVQ